MCESELLPSTKITAHSTLGNAQIKREMLGDAGTSRWVGTCGLLLSSIAGLLLIFWPTIFNYFLQQQMKIRDNSLMFKLWKEPPVPQHMDVYFFNWTNPENITSSKPILVEIGPYRFKITEKKTHLNFNENGTVSFKIKRFWYFDAEKSVGSLNDEVVTLNALAKTALRVVRYRGTFIKSSLSVAMRIQNTKIYVKKRVGELLFDGYTDELLQVAQSLPNIADIRIPFDKFGWFYERNGSDAFEGLFNMDTGVGDIHNLGVLRNWNNKNSSNFYPGSCALLNGSAGELYPPHRTKNSTIELFSPDLCRSLKLQYDEEVEVSGIKGYKYSGSNYTFDNGTLDPANECFCDGECSPIGVLNVTTCRYGAPGFISYPHFYLGDPYFADQVIGIKPEPNKHKLYITLEPETGIPLDVAARFQINILLTEEPLVSAFRDVPKIYFPMIWFEQRATITEDLVFQIKLAKILPQVGRYVAAALLVGGLIILLIAVRSRRKQRRRIKCKFQSVKLIPGSNFKEESHL